MYGDSQALLSSDSMSIFPSNSKPKEDVSVAAKEQQFLFMESDANNYSNNSGLLRFRSAPTSLLANFGNEKLGSISRFCSDEDNRFAGMNNSQLPPQYPRQSGSNLGDYRVLSTSSSSSLMRQNSSPAGLLSQQNGYAGVRGYRMADTDDHLSPSMKNHMNLSSSLGLLSQITEVENEHSLDYTKVGNSSGDTLFASSGFPFSSWNDSSYFAENLSNSIKREVDNDPKLFVNPQNQNEEAANRPYTLSSHLSLPKTSAEMAAMEKLFQLQDTVPCKIRAKRGCATHPRSIAERVRRTRISERMRKLQELVPNMDKQTNTADMLDLAVEHIKSLQTQYKILSDNRANCKCSASQKIFLNQAQ